MKAADPHAPAPTSYRLQQAYAFVPLVIAAFAFGVFASYSPSPNQACRAGNFGDALNATLTMLRGGSVCASGASGQLKLAQDLLPLLLYLGGLYAGVKLIIAGLRHDAKVAMVRRLRGHTIVCGLGETGLEAIRQLADKQGKIVAICLDEGEPGAKICERLGVAVIAGDATLARTLSAGGIARARAVVMCTGSDALNMEICLTIDAARRGLGHELKLFPEVRGSWLLETLGLGHAPIVGGRLELHPFRANQIIARTLLRSPLFLRNGAAPRLLFVGFGDLAQAILRDAVLSNYAFPGTVVHAVAFDQQEAAAPAKAAASWRHFVEIEHRRHRFGGGEDIDESTLKAELEQAMPDLVVITLPGDDLALQIAVLMRRALDVMSRCDIPVFVRVRDQSLLSGVLSGISAVPFCHGRLGGFGDLSDVVAPGALFDEHLDILARAVHETYLASTATESPARVAWENLAERFRRSNRLAADHIAAKLHYAGFRAVPGDFPSAVFDDEAVEAMARAEHYRWCLTLQAHGWRQDAVRSELLRTHPLLLPWTDLPETVRQGSRDEVAAIPKALARIGCSVQRIETFTADAAPPDAPSVLPCMVVDPAKEADCAAAERFVESAGGRVKFVRPARLHAESLQTLAETFPRLAGAFDGWLAAAPLPADTPVKELAT